MIQVRNFIRTYILLPACSAHTTPFFRPAPALLLTQLRLPTIPVRTSHALSPTLGAQPLSATRNRFGTVLVGVDPARSLRRRALAVLLAHHRSSAIRVPCFTCSVYFRTQSMLPAYTGIRAIGFRPSNAPSIVPCHTRTSLHTRRSATTIIVKHRNASTFLRRAFPLVPAHRRVRTVKVGRGDTRTVTPGNT